MKYMQCSIAFYATLKQNQAMDSRELQIFQYLARHLHFGKTASAHYLSPSTLSRMIRRMELQLGTSLFLRDNRSVQLTVAGANLLAYADQQQEQWIRLKDSINQDQDHLSGQLHLFCTVTAAYSHLPPLLDKFRRAHPAVEIILTTGDAADAIGQVQQGQVDIALAAMPEPLNEQLHFVAIESVELAVIAPRFSTELGEQLRQDPINWQNLPFILPEHGPARKRFNLWFKQHSQQKAKIYASVSGHEALVSMVALGCGVGIAPKVVVENSPVRDRVQYLASDTAIQPFTLGICCLKPQRQRPNIAAFLQAVESPVSPAFENDKYRRNKRKRLKKAKKESKNKPDSFDFLTKRDFSVD